MVFSCVPLKGSYRASTLWAPTLHRSSSHCASSSILKAIRIALRFGGISREREMSSKSFSKSAVEFKRAEL